MGDNWSLFLIILDKLLMVRSDGTKYLILSRTGKCFSVFSRSTITGTLSGYCRIIHSESFFLAEKLFLCLKGLHVCPFIVIKYPLKRAHEDKQNYSYSHACLAVFFPRSLCALPLHRVSVGICPQRPGRPGLPGLPGLPPPTTSVVCWVGHWAPAVLWPSGCLDSAMSEAEGPRCVA